MGTVIYRHESRNYVYMQYVGRFKDFQVVAGVTGMYC